MDESRLSYNNYPGYIRNGFFGLVFMAVGTGIFFGISPFSSQKSDLGAVFFILGLITACAFTFRSLQADKVAGKLNYSYQSVLSRGNVEVPLASIASVRFTKIQIPGRKRRRWEAHIIFKQSDGNELDVPQTILRQEDAKRVADFIAVPFFYEMPPSLTESIGAIGSAISAGAQRYQQEMDKKPPQ